MLSVTIMEYPVTGVQCVVSYHYGISSDWVQCAVSYHYGISSDGCSVLSVTIMEYPVTGVQCAVSYHYGISSDWGAVHCQLPLWNIQ